MPKMFLHEASLVSRLNFWGERAGWHLTARRGSLVSFVASRKAARLVQLCRRGASEVLACSGKSNTALCTYACTAAQASAGGGVLLVGVPHERAGLMVLTQNDTQEVLIFVEYQAV